MSADVGVPLIAGLLLACCVALAFVGKKVRELEDRT